MFGGTQQAIKRAQQRLVGAEVEREQLVELLRDHVGHRHQIAEDRGVEHQNVELAPATAHGLGQPVNLFGFAQIQGCDGGGATSGMNAGFDFLQCALGPAGQQHMCASQRQRFGGRRANPAGGTGHQGDTPRQRLRHARTARSPSNDS